MSEKFFKTKRGDEIVIEVSRPSREGFGGRKAHSPERGMIFPHRRSEYFPRRLTGGVSFYDMGQRRVGDAFVDEIVSLSQMLISFYPLPRIQTEPSNQQLAAAARHFASFFDPELEVAPESVFKQIKKEEAGIFNLKIESPKIPSTTLDPTSDKWKNDKIDLKKDELENILIESNPFYGYLDFAPDGSLITNAPDYESAPVADFALAPGDKIFLIPAICQPNIKFSMRDRSGDRNDVFTGNNGVYDITGYLFGDYVSFPRRFFADDIETWQTLAFEPFRIDQQNFYNFSPATYALFYKTVEFFRARAGTLPYLELDGFTTTTEANGDVVTTPIKNVQFETPANFPKSTVFPAPSGSFVPAENGAGIPGVYRAQWRVYDAPRTLLAIVKRGEALFYVWTP